MLWAPSAIASVDLGTARRRLIEETSAMPRTDARDRWRVDRDPGDGAFDFPDLIKALLDARASRSGLTTSAAFGSTSAAQRTTSRRPRRGRHSTTWARTRQRLLRPSPPPPADSFSIPARRRTRPTYDLAMPRYLHTMY